MKAKRKKLLADELRPAYDFSKAERGKYYARVMKGTNVVVLDPDVAVRFTTSKAVNSALRRLLRMDSKQRPANRTKPRAA